MPGHCVSPFSQFYLPWIRIDLGELNLMGGDWLSVSIEDQESGARSALVDGPNKDV